MNVLQKILSDYWNSDERANISKSVELQKIENLFLNPLETNRSKYLEMEDKLCVLESEYEQIGFMAGFKIATELWQQATLSS